MQASDTKETHQEEGRDMAKKFAIVVAATHQAYGIGRQGTLPWRLKGDMQFFKTITTTLTEPIIAAGCGVATATVTRQNAVIMGRKTYLSIPDKFRPLEGRLNVVLSSNANVREELNLPDSVLVASSLNDAWKLLSAPDRAAEIDQIFVIGGASVYKEAINSPHCGTVYLTKVMKEFDDLDTFFPQLSADRFSLTTRGKLITENDIAYQLLTFRSVNEGETELAPPVVASIPTAIIAVKQSGNAEEQQYLDLIKTILDIGVRRGDRTGTGTISKFGVQMRFSLRDNTFPLLTTKKVFFRGVAEELLWFVAGCTNANVLSAKGIKIWDGNGSREFLDKSGLGHREVGDLGPVYGFQVSCFFIFLLDSR
jgi:dihydrofolate reductase/thymidylate synthase